MMVVRDICDFLKQHFPPKSNYTYDDIPSQQGKVVIVTGGNSGIGKETARVLLSKGAHVYLACRDEERGKMALEELKEVTGKESIDLLKLDLRNVNSAIAAAEDFKEYNVPCRRWQLEARY
jgi:retinol dehydrogenase 12